MSDRYLAIKVVMMPRDTNPQGTIFGGVLLSYIDQAAAIGAHYEIQRRGGRAPMIVTVAMNEVEFHQPVFVGDILSFYSEFVRIGRTSITIKVTVEAERKGQTLNVTQAQVVYVVIDPATRRPTPILPEQPTSTGAR
jgi:acyl-CoA thioesterase YciA